MSKLTRSINLIHSFYLRHRYAILFYSLLLSLAAIPIFATLQFSGRLIEILFAANLLAAILPIRAGKIRLILMVVMLGSFGTQLGDTWFHQYQVLNKTIIIWAMVGLLGAFAALRFTLRASAVHSEHIFAALSAYLLAGIFLGSVYWLLEQKWPGSLLIGGQAPGTKFSVAEGVYFSFVTLATLGYGDIVPASNMARGIAIVETIAGQLYLAVMVARLLSLYVTKSSEKV